MKTNETKVALFMSDREVTDVLDTVVRKNADGYILVDYSRRRISLDDPITKYILTFEKEENV